VVSVDLYVSATIDFGEVEKGLDAMARRARALGPAFRELKKPLKLDQKDHSKKRQGPSAMWAPRAASTMARLRQGSRRAKKPMGRLPSATRYTSDATSVTGRSKALWSGVHQDGGTVGHGSRLPARPFLWISDDMLTIAENTLGAALVRAYGGN
jgi:phage gpG-like protein